MNNHRKDSPFHFQVKKWNGDTCIMIEPPPLSNAINVVLTSPPIFTSVSAL